MSVNQWAGQSTLQGRMWHHWNADLKRRIDDQRVAKEILDEAAPAMNAAWAKRNACPTCGGIKQPGGTFYPDNESFLKGLGCPDCSEVLLAGALIVMEEVVKSFPSWQREDIECFWDPRPVMEALIAAGWRLDLGGGHEFTDEALEQRDRIAVTEVLIDHMLAIEERRRQRTETTWPDESDIYADTIKRLRVMFAQGGTLMTEISEAAVEAAARAGFEWNHHETQTSSCPLWGTDTEAMETVRAFHRRRATECLTAALPYLTGETACATCGDKRKVRGERVDASSAAYWIPCPDCGVETPEAAVGRWNAKEQRFSATRPAVTCRCSDPGCFHKMMDRDWEPVYRRADLIAAGWTPPGGEAK